MLHFSPHGSTHPTAVRAELSWSAGPGVPDVDASALLLAVSTILAVRLSLKLSAVYEADFANDCTTMLSN